MQVSVSEAQAIVAVDHERRNRELKRDDGVVSIEAPHLAGVQKEELEHERVDDAGKGIHARRDEEGSLGRGVLAADEDESGEILHREERPRNDHEHVERFEAAQISLLLGVGWRVHLQASCCRSETNEHAHLNGFGEAFEDAVEAEADIVEADVEP